MSHYLKTASVRASVSLITTVPITFNIEKTVPAFESDGVSAVAGCFGSDILTHSYSHYPSLYSDGRLEDGYLAWTSVYLHEYFGFKIYHPLSPLEQFEMKQDVDHMPPWIHDFTALPNLAILLSYFCIGVALQLLRTPLIVYFISTQDATPAQVNVLFTVSKFARTRLNMFLGDNTMPYSQLFLLLKWQFLGASRLSMDFFPTVFPLMD